MATPKQYMYSILLFAAFLNGWFVSSFGPLIPHFSDATGLDQTHYSYLFLVRSLANITGGFLIKYLLKIFKTGVVLNGTFGVISLSLFASTFSLSTVNLSISIFCTSLGLIAGVVIVYGVTFKLFLKEQPDYWIQLLGFVFGVGAMCGPFLVAIFKLNTFSVLGFAHILTLVAISQHTVPCLMETQAQQSQTKNAPRLSKKSILFISLIFFIFATEELGVASWISTYSIKAGIADVQSSAIYSLLFWIPNCIGRLVWIFIPGKIEDRLRLSLKVTIFIMGFSLIFQYAEWYRFVCIFVPIGTGIFMAGVYGFCIALAVDNGFVTSPQDNANFILSNSIGEGLLITPLGYSMNLFGYKALMVEIFGSSILSYWSFCRAMESMEQDKQKFSAQTLLINKSEQKQLHN